MLLLPVHASPSLSTFASDTTPAYPATRLLVVVAHFVVYFYFSLKAITFNFAVKFDFVDCFLWQRTAARASLHTNAFGRACIVFACDGIQVCV